MYEPEPFEPFAFSSLPSVIEATETTPIVEVQGAKEGLVVGPNDVLVMHFPFLSARDLEAVRDHFKTTGLRDDQFILINGTLNMSKVER